MWLYLLSICVPLSLLHVVVVLVLCGRKTLMSSVLPTPKTAKDEEKADKKVQLKQIKKRVRSNSPPSQHFKFVF